MKIDMVCNVSTDELGKEEKAFIAVGEDFVRIRVLQDWSEYDKHISCEISRNTFERMIKAYEGYKDEEPHNYTDSTPIYDFTSKL